MRSKLFGDVDWYSEQVDDEYAFLTVTPIQIFAQDLGPDVFNLLHVHIPSVGESATVDIKCMKKFDEPENYHTFKKDITGNTLKYKILIQNNTVRSILYNFRGKIRELESSSFKYKLDEIVNVKSLGIPDVTYARIVSIPIQTLASLDQDKLAQYERTAPKYELVGVCRSRYFEELMGYIDLELIPNVEEQPINQRRVSAPVCECKRGIEEHKKGMQIIQGWKNKIAKKCMNLVNLTKEKIQVINAKEYESTSTAEKSQLLELLQKMEGELMTLIQSELSTVDPVAVACD